MQRIKTKSFTLATIMAGDEHAERLAIVLPGLLDSKDYVHMVSLVEHLASLGFLAVSFDPPGTWESDGDLTLFTLTNYVAAVGELIEYFGNRPTALVGHSLGGIVALLQGAQNQFVTHVGAIMSPSAVRGLAKDDWKEKGYRDSYRDPAPGAVPLENYERDGIHLKLPYAFYEDGIQYDLIATAGAVAQPKLFIAGTRDMNVTPENVQGLYNAAPEPKEYREIDWDHNYRYSDERMQEVNQIITNFLEAHDND